MLEAGGSLVAKPGDVVRPRLDLPVVILCGGEGTRFHEESQYRPKPLAEIGGLPILCHIMKNYAAHGFRRFVLCLGYKGAMIKEFFLRFEITRRNFTLRLGDGEPRFFGDTADMQDWEISFIDTGPHTMTGGRLKQIEPFIDSDHFMVTYGDGVADVDIAALLDFHIKHGGIGTVTGVQSFSQFGELRVDDDVVLSFSEKPKVHSVINGGFFVFRRDFFDYLSADEACILEREPLIRLTAARQLRVYRHPGFWQCMDTLKDYRLLNDLWLAGDPPWIRVNSRAPAHG